MRKVAGANIALLTGFDFNLAAKFEATVFAPFTATVNRVTGECVITLPPFIPKNMIAAPSGATHFNLFTAATAVDFETETFTTSDEQSGHVEWGQQSTLVTTLQCSLPANSTHPIFMVLGIEFVQEVNGVMYPLRNGAYNAMAMVKVDGV
jgi:hypothetical protein